MTIQEKLDRLYVLRADFMDLQIEKEKSQSALIPAEIRERLNQLEEEYAFKFQQNVTAREQLEAEIRRDVALRQENAKGASGMSAVYSPGRITWDTRGLEGYAKVHKEVLEFRKQGDGFVTIK